MRIVRHNIRRVERRRRRSHRREASRHDAHHQAGLLVEGECLADDPGIRAEASLPVAVVEHHDAIPPVLVFVGQEGAAQHGLSVLHVEPVRGSAGCVNLFRLAVAGEVHAAVLVGGERGEGTQAVVQPLINLGRKKEAAVRPGMADSHYAIGLVSRQGTQEDAVHYGEHGGIRAYPERQSDRSGHCEPRATPKPPESDGKIAEHGKPGGRRQSGGQERQSGRRKKPTP